MEIKYISVHLGDHDFQMTFVPLLETLAEAFNPEWFFESELSKEVVIKTIHEGIIFHFLAFQLRNNYNPKIHDLEKIKKYLQKGLKISFNSEALKAAHDYDCWLLNTQSGQITTYDKETKNEN